MEVSTYIPTAEEARFDIDPDGGGDEYEPPSSAIDIRSLVVAAVTLGLESYLLEPEDRA